MNNYGKSKKYEECGCKKSMSSNYWKKDDQLDDIVHLLKKILDEKKDKDHKKDNDDKKDKHCKEECEVVTVTFDLDDHQVEFISPGNSPFGCSVNIDQTTITEVTRCLLNQGFKIVTYVAAFEADELGGDTALGTYTFVRCR